MPYCHIMWTNSTKPVTVIKIDSLILVQGFYLFTLSMRYIDAKYRDDNLGPNVLFWNWQWHKLCKKWLTWVSKMRFVFGGNAMISPDMRQSFLFSSRTVFMLSIHSESTGPSKISHLRSIMVQYKESDCTFLSGINHHYDFELGICFCFVFIRFAKHKNRGKLVLGPLDDTFNIRRIALFKKWLPKKS